MWPGSNFDYNGTKCSHTVAYNETESWYSRVDTVISWFIDKRKPANLVMLYIEQPDSYAHVFSPESSVVSVFGNIFFFNWRKMCQAKCSMGIRIWKIQRVKFFG